ncbi:hypothetical protein D9Q98_009230 [Chlorella vulgaris]|uniref:peptidylprolyl isomerase n=1 Tax=Chlorella vulgaris TaxID=3077 RepID=A0A9D4TQE9_CHLVU|nr:hypothetical protein D9Q98_009230 [Chlorella vulgaris]
MAVQAAGVTALRPSPAARLRPCQAGQRRTLKARIVCQADGQKPDSSTTAADAKPAAAEDEPGSPSAGGSVREALRAAEAAPGTDGKRRRQAESTDAIASSLTRRFGLAGGLAWVGFLAFGVIGEQVKTRLELASEEANTKDVSNAKEVVTPEGLRYTDLKLGGGSPPVPGYIIVLDYKAYANGQLFEDTLARGKPIVFLYGKRPLAGGMCPGAEQALSTMRAGGRRRVTIPPQLGFGDSGVTLRPTEHVPEKAGVVPPGATLEYELSLVRVSIPPS